MDTGNRRIEGLAALLGTVVLWGSSFPGIKLVVGIVDPMTYVWLRSLIASTALIPYILYRLVKGYDLKHSVHGGLVAGLFFALGLWLQGWGTRFTSASNSAFITGLNVVFVHIYVALDKRSYDMRLRLSLILSLAGLYFLTAPQGGFKIGDALVLLGAFMWAAQIILIDKYRPRDPIAFTYAELVPSTLFLVPATLVYGTPRIPLEAILITIYLALACADGAFILQALGQRYVDPATTAIVFLLEPVFATLFSLALLHEQVTALQLMGMALILSALYISVMRNHDG